MAKWIVLDSTPLSLLATPLKRGGSSLTADLWQWIAACDTAGHHILVPEIIDYEVRRELLRSGKSASIVELDKLKIDFTYLPVTTDAFLKAAELWSSARQQGRPTSHDENIDVDMILAAQALTLTAPQVDVVVATSNIRHLSLFVNAADWRTITP